MISRSSSLSLKVRSLSLSLSLSSPHYYVVRYLTIESLVELKKQRLLLMLQPSEGEEEGGVAIGGQPSYTPEEEDGEEVSGMKCRAPLKEV